MTKRDRAVPFVLCGLFVLPILFEILKVSISLGWNIDFAVSLACVNIIIVAIITYGATVVTFLNRGEIRGNVLTMYFVALALSAVFSVYYLLNSSVRSAVFTVILFSVFMCCITNCIVILPRAKARMIFALASTLPVLIILFIFVLVFFFTLNPLGESTTRGIYTSPEGSYTIEVIDVDEGGLGGDTVVKLYYEKPILDLGIIKITKNPRTIYFDSRYKAEISISFIDDDTVIINSEEFEL